MALFIEPTLTWRFLTPTDHEELQGLRDQLDIFDDSVLSSISVAATPGDGTLVPELTVGGWDSYDSLSAFAGAYLAPGPELRLHLLGGVHPGHRNMTIGGSVLNWQLAAAQEWRDLHHPGEQLWVGCYSEIGRPGVESVASTLGFTPERFYFDLIRDLAAPAPTCPCPPGVVIEPFSQEHSEAVRQLHNECFVDLGGVEVGADTWAERIADQAFRPGWSFLAFSERGELVGYQISSADRAVDHVGVAGWTERFGVAEQHRGKGIALRLLSEGLGAMQADGCVEAGIGIDTVTGKAPDRLAWELGYTTRDAVALLSTVLP